MRAANVRRFLARFCHERRPADSDRAQAFVEKCIVSGRFDVQSERKSKSRDGISILQDLSQLHLGVGLDRVARRS